MHSMARSAAWFFDVSPSSHRGLDNLIRRAEAWKRFLYGEIQPVIYIHPAQADAHVRLVVVARASKTVQ